jgi:hypothetical protein
MHSVPGLHHKSHAQLGIFDSVVCTGQFKDAHKNAGHEVVTKLSKAQVRCAFLNAFILKYI